MRFQRRERLSDELLARAVREITKGLVDADLGGGVLKQRIARRGQGKRGGYRTILALRQGERAVFLYGFAKSERDNIDDDELEELREQGRAWLGLSEPQVGAAIQSGELQEVAFADDENEAP